MSINIHDIEAARARILKLAKNMLQGECTYIEGSREIVQLLEKARIDCYEKPFITFVGIDSETDNVPFGWLRDTWQAQARARLEPEWAQAEQYAKSLGEPACRGVMTWFASKPAI